MKEETTCLIVTPDGRRLPVSLPGRVLRRARTANGVAAPPGLLSQLRVSAKSETAWRLRSAASRAGGRPHLFSGREEEGAPPELCLVGAVVAGARESHFDPRQARLKKERQALEKLALESDYVRVEALDQVEGSEPEHYRVTFLCRGIAGIDGSERPVYSERHEVVIHCDDSFPSDVPKLRWETPIWHPNIQHIEPKGVCVNKSEWLGGMGLDDLVRQMFEMVQYKNYHADEATPPFPLDRKVARWVREYAEPAGILDKRRGIYVDDKPFTRPTDVNTAATRIKLLPPKEPGVKPRGPGSGIIKVISTTIASVPPPAGARGRIKIKKQE